MTYKLVLNRRTKEVAEMMTVNKITDAIIGQANGVHRTLVGAQLLKAAYNECWLWITKPKRKRFVTYASPR